MATVESNGATIYYEVHGQGEAVVFAHGRGGNGASWWQQVPHFSRKYRVIVFDHRAFGRSVGGAETFTQRQLADDLVAILEAEGIARAAVVTQSMGGWTGLGAAVYHRKRVSCLVLASTLAGLLTPEARTALDSLAPDAVPLPGRALAPDYPEREPEMTMLYAQLSAFNTAFDPRSIDFFRDPANAIGPERLEGYDVPTLFISGEHDRIFPPHVISSVAAALPGAELEPFPGAGHSPYWENAPLFNEMVEKFLAKHLKG